MLSRIVTSLAVLGLACTLAAVPPGAVRAFEDKAAAAADKSHDLTEGTKQGKYTVASTVGFDAAFGLNFPSLSTVGARIDKARRAADPVSLALAAKELEVAEAVSKKKASLTAKDLMGEAVELGRQRGDAKELKALSLLVATTEDKTKESLEKAVAKAEKEEGSRGIRARLTVHNWRNNTLRLYYNGYGVGTVPPRASRSFGINDTSGADFSLRAEDDFGRRWRNNYSGSVNNFSWTVR